MKNIKDYILELLQEKYSIDNMDNVDELNYVEEGYVDSFGLFQFVADLEEYFQIEFSDEEMMSDDFKVIGKLQNIIENKLNDN